MTSGSAATTPGCCRTCASTSRQLSSRSPAPKVRTRRWGLATRMRERRSLRRPFITPSTTISAITPTATPPVAMTVWSDANFEDRRDRRYRPAIRRSSRVGHRRIAPNPAAGASAPPLFSSTAVPLTVLGLRPHRGEQDHVANRGLVGDQHDQPVDADTDAAGGRHPVFERPDVVGIVLLSLGIPGLPLPGLIF